MTEGVTAVGVGVAVGAAEGAGVGAGLAVGVVAGGVGVIMLERSAGYTIGRVYYS